MTRTQAREQAFLLLFEQSFHHDPIANRIADAAEARDLHADDYALQAVDAVEAHLAELDECIAAYSKGWRIERLSRVALTALRLALAEMRYFDDVPVSVSINEAVELCKRYATQDDAAFVNGILGSVARADSGETT